MADTWEDSYEITAQYPYDITLPQNVLRSIHILVKQQTGIAGGLDKLKAMVAKKSNEIKEIMEGNTVDVTPSEATRRAGMKSRMMKLSTGMKTIWGIALPLPNELTDSQSHKWETTDGIVSKVGSGLLNKLGGKLLGIDVNAAVGEASSKMGYRKPMIDPGYFQDYNGTVPRAFSFSWDLIPNTSDEAETIQHIIYNLKKFTLPRAVLGGVTMLSPFLFDIEIGNPKISELMNMNNVVCTDMNINYAAEGSLQFFKDGTPKYIKLEMSFAERASITSDMY